MDQIKIGKFIAALRKEKGLTQEQLGEKLGVTNKTVSRWENGNYMPDVEMLLLLSKEFGISINELISGERLELEDFKKTAEPSAYQSQRVPPLSAAVLFFFSIIINVPTAMKTTPSAFAGVSGSRRKIKASKMVRTVLDLSMGTTLLISPSCKALK